MISLRPGRLVRAAALLLLAVAAPAGTVRRPSAARPGPLFAAPAAAWAARLSAPLLKVAASGHAQNLSVLLKLDLKDPIQSRALAPLVHQLEAALELTPEKLAALPEDQQRSAVQLAAEEAVEQVRQHASALVGETGNLVWLTSLDKTQRAALFRVVAHLQELKAHYGPYLDDDLRELADKSYVQASARAYEIRRELVEALADGGAKALSGALPASPARGPPAAPKPGFVPPPPTSTARKLFEEMRAHSKNKSNDDLDTLLTGYGFVRTTGGAHPKYTYAPHPGLFERPLTGSNHNPLKPGYVDSAIAAIEVIEALRAAQAEQAAQAQADASRTQRFKPPAKVDLDELEVLLSPPAPSPVAAEERAAAQLAAAAKAAIEAESKLAPAPSPRPQAKLTPAQPERKPEPKAATPTPEKTDPDAEKSPFRHFINRLKRLKPR